MKIVRLTFSGVRSYPDTCTIDFTGKTLVGILGDTGAGKTSILEAITAALYGKCSWTDRVAQLRSDDCQTMMVDLVFSVDGQECAVHRVFHESRPTQAGLTDPDGKHTDGVRAVDEAIRALIGIDYVTFKSSVLVPQGRFDELLNAGDAERTRILKSLFGVDELQRVRQLATESVSRLKDLIGQARLHDARLHEDPRSAVQAARARHERAASGARDLSDRLAQLRGLQTQAAQAEQHARVSSDAAAALTERRITNYSHTIASIRQAQDELQQLQEANTEAQGATQAGLEAVTAEQDAAIAAGLAPAALAGAAQILRDMPGRLGTLAEGNTTHAQLLTELKEEEESLAERASRLKEAERHIEELRAQMQDAEEEEDGAAQTLKTLTVAVRRACEAASALAQRRTDHNLTQNKLTALTQAPPGSNLDEARETAQQAQDALEAILRQEAAHTAGGGLSAGDGCPVCSQTLPPHYTPPQPQDARALTRAKASVKKASAAVKAAEQEHDRYAHEIEQLQLAGDEHLHHVQEAVDRLAEALPSVREQAEKLAARSGHPQPGVYAKELEGSAETVVSRMADTAPPTAAEQENLVDALLVDAHSRVAQLHEVAAGSRDELVQAESTLGVERASLESATRALEKRRAQSRQATERLEKEKRGLLISLTALPELAQAHLPRQPLLPAEDHLMAASEAVRQEQHHQEQLAEQQEQLRTRVHSLKAERAELAERQHRDVTEPLQQLQARLQRWADSAASAAALVEQPQRPTLPAPAQAQAPATTEEYAAALEAASILLLAALDGHDIAARAAMEELTTGLSAHAEAVATTYPDAVVLQVSSETDPLDSTLLDGLSSHAGTLGNEAKRARQDEEQALSQIPHKDRLTAAIAAGERQLVAWQAVSTHLTDGKFLGHLTDLRTRALLAHGSELLQQLSGRRLGFAANFDIVSLASHTRRSSRTLSGGETFQASLALSLALMEMHGRSGIRLESLFLDEGFGTLDTASLDGALQVLRTNVGADKLLAVISHLRPVAETVHDVLWVEKDHCGSRARWLTAAERDILVREDLHNLADLT